MKMKKKDLILRMAFEECTEEEKQLLAGFTEEELAELKAAQLMKEGLDAMREVPECQLSTERVRDAILKERVKPGKSNVFSLGWTVAGMASVFMAYFVWQGVDALELDGGELTVVEVERHLFVRELAARQNELALGRLRRRFAGDVAEPRGASRRAHAVTSA